MGAKQSKRSVDISGKEAEGAGEVAAAGAGGEGRVEPLADADVKPQLNGDAHIHEQTDKEKQLDSGTPENEKDATTEKEGKQEDAEKDKDAAAPVTNGESEEQKTENGDSAVTPDDAKKPKKEKVKKKWSLRSISFSRKDKPKQEKKQKEEEPKTNGEPEKVPEEAAEVTPEPVANEVSEVKSDTETKDEKTPETPVTEPITNGSNTPESPKVEVPVSEEAAPVASPESDKTEPEIKPEPEPEQLPVNGLSLEETKSEETVTPNVEESKPDESSADTTETAPAIEIPVKKEVCVEQMPLIEPTPPPLPANPPPSSVVSFAATTMAPDLTDASLANTAENAISTPPAVLNTKPEISNEKLTEIPTDLTNSETSVEVPSLIKTNDENGMIKQADSSSNETSEQETGAINEIRKVKSEITPNEVAREEITVNESVESKENIPVVSESNVEVIPDFESTPEPPAPVKPESSEEVATIPEASDESTIITSVPVDESISITPQTEKPEQDDSIPEPMEDVPEPTAAVLEQSIPSEVNEELPPPPPEDDEIDIKMETSIEQMEKSIKEELNHETEEILKCNHTNVEVNGIGEEALDGNKNIEQENIKNKSKVSLPAVECNGNIEEVDNVTKDEASTTEPGSESLPPSPAEGASASDSFPAPPSDLGSPPASPAAPPQESIAVSDKLADLIPEVPVVPDLKTETALETTGAADN